MSFTLEIKKELINRGIAENGTLAEKTAGLSAFIQTSAQFGFSGGTPTFFLVSQTERVIEYFMGVFSELYDCDLSIAHAAQDKRSGRDKLVVECPLAQSPHILSSLGLLKRGAEDFRKGILPSIIKADEEKIAYIRGAFLGGGSCTLPNANGTGYHLEIVFNERETARDFCRLLSEFELLARYIERKENFIVYIKSKEIISDFLSIMGAENALRKFTVFLDKRDEANNDNRTRNCMAGNADKAAIAAVKQVVAIQKILDNDAFKDLSEDLKVLAHARLKYTDKTLQELAEHLGESKSCINHRMRKLLAIAEEIK